MASQVTIPYQVLVYADGTCGGSILSSLLIITAAHCVKGVPKHRISITAGTKEPWNESTNKQVRKAETVIIHPRYRHAALFNDVALIILNKPLEFNTNVASIELPRNGEEFEGRATASGWGDTTEGGSGSSILKYVVLPIVPYAQCKRSYGYLRREQMCAGETGLDTCEGDSGGPVACKRKGYRKQILCGVTSRGNGCGRPGFPGIAVKVSSYIHWIEQMRRQRGV